MTDIKCISVSPEFAMKAKELNISWSEAARVGMAMIFAERGERDYDNKLNLHRKMNFFRQQAEEALQKLTDLEKKDIEKQNEKERDNSQAL